MADDLDRLLDEGLASYVGAEPRPGLEQRVLHRVRSESAPRRRSWMWWAAPIPVAACLVAAVLMWHGDAPPLERPAKVEVAVSQPVTVVPPAEPPAPPAGKKPRRPALPKLDVFPTPSPLTPEERALLGFVRRAPPEAPLPLDGPASRAIEPIRIDNIELQPLEITDDTQ